MKPILPMCVRVSFKASEKCVDATIRVVSFTQLFHFILFEIPPPPPPISEPHPCMTFDATCKLANY